MRPGNREYQAALRAIWDRSAYERGYISNPFLGERLARLGLERTTELLERLGNPQTRYGIIHIAGSKGKGSTAAIAAAILTAAGYRCGLYTSPHLHRFTERIAIDGEPISDADFAAVTKRVLKATRALEQHDPTLAPVTAFELSTVMALQHFADRRCDLAVVEVGLGGSLDATNVVLPRVSVITIIDYEHTAVLGNTLAEIATNKAGIIKTGRPVVTAPQPADALAVIRLVAERHRSPLTVATPDWVVPEEGETFALVGPWGRYGNLELRLAGEHQRQNASLAVAAIHLLGADADRVSEDAVRAGLERVRWPGRFELVRTDSGTTIVLDGAHTQASAQALRRTCEAQLDRRPVVLIIGTGSDKEPAAILAPLISMVDHLIATQARSPRARPAADIAAAATALRQTPELIPNVAEAVARAVTLAGPAGLVVVTGSLYVVAEAREALGLAIPDPSFER